MVTHNLPVRRVGGTAARMDESPFNPPVWGLSSLRPGITRFQVNMENLGEVA